MKIPDYPVREDNETAWEWEPGVVAITIPCGCDNGYRLGSIRVCPDCHGLNHQVARTEPDKRTAS